MKFSDLITVGGNVSVVGGGTTGLIEALERELHQAGHAAMNSVTTRMGRWQLPYLKLFEAKLWLKP